MDGDENPRAPLCRARLYDEIAMGRKEWGGGRACINGLDDDIVPTVMRGTVKSDHFAVMP